MEHADLVAEMHSVENLPTQDRLHLARLRRAQQLKVARQKEKEWQKMQNRRDKLQMSHSKKTQRHISFENSVVLLEASGRNDIQEVAQLLEKGMTPNASNEDGLTALHQCCIDNNIEMLKLLLDYDANVDAQDSDKWTPLHAAATCGHLNLVKILINRGANLLAVNTDGNMPYDLCDDEETLDYIEAEMSKRGITQELIDETRALTERKMLADLIEIANNSGDLEEADHQGATPLHIAAANGYTSVVEFLLEHHVNVDTVDKDLWSPVHAAACWGHLEVLEMLAQYGANLDAKNKDEETPSDICEDSEIRERIEQLKSEQESKRMAEAQRRRVRRSQSNNTRAQSVRRTSLRDKTLTTKKDAVEETRLRLQAQEVLCSPETSNISNEPKLVSNTNGSDIIDSVGVLSLQTVTNHKCDQSSLATSKSYSSISGSESINSVINASSMNVLTPSLEQHQHQQFSKTSSNSLSSYGLFNSNVNGNVKSIKTHKSHHQHRSSNSSLDINENNSGNNNCNKNGNNHNSSERINSVNNQTNGGSGCNSNLESFGIEKTQNKDFNTNCYNNSNNELTSLHKSLYTTESSMTLNLDRKPPEGKDSEDFSSYNCNNKILVCQQHKHNSLDNLRKSNELSTEIFSTSTESGKINVQVTVLVDTHNLDNTIIQSGATLANLKKQRSLSRTNAASENGSIVAATSHCNTISSKTTNSKSGHHQSSIELSSNKLGTLTEPSNIVGIGKNSLSSSTLLTRQISSSATSLYQQPITKFSGDTSDVVSDSTRSKKCCLVM